MRKAFLLVFVLLAMAAVIAVLTYFTDPYNNTREDEWIVLYDYNKGVEFIPGTPFVKDAGFKPDRFSTRNAYVKNNYFVYQGELVYGNYGVSYYEYKISGSNLYLHLKAGHYPHFAETGMIDIKIKNKRMKDIEKIILWDEDEENCRTIWVRGIGFTPKIYAEPRNIISYDVTVEDDCIVYKGEINSDIFGYYGYGYGRGFNGDTGILTYYIWIACNFMPDITASKTFEIRIEDESISKLRIDRIVFGVPYYNADVEVIWEREKGFVGQNGAKELLGEEAYFKKLDSLAK